MNKKILKAAAIGALFVASSTQAIIGVGFHWGFDGSLHMEDSFNEQIRINTTPTFTAGTIIDNTFNSAVQNDETLKAALDSLDAILGTISGPINSVQDLIDTLTSEATSDIQANLPFYLSRSEWTRSMINIGGKVWVDLKRLRLINALEASFNLGVWEYKGTLHYPKNVKSNLNQSNVENFLKNGNYNELFEMESADITLEEVGMDYLKFFGVSQTPVMKFHLDLTVKKNLVAKPEVSKRFKLYLGAGPSLHLATPILTPKFINDIVNESIEGATSSITAGDMLFNGEGLQEKILDKLIEEAKNPTFGAHIVLGTSLKLPVVPIAFYIDGKYNFFFGDIDDNVEIKAKGYKRFLLNIGAAINF